MIKTDRLKKQKEYKKRKVMYQNPKDKRKSRIITQYRV